MIYHPLLALSKIKGLTEVVIIGFYEDSLFADFIKQAKREFPGLSITYVPYVPGVLRPIVHIVSCLLLRPRPIRFVASEEKV
jgi:mannose-1-phosphate guanylyltransferase